MKGAMQKSKCKMQIEKLKITEDRNILTLAFCNVKADMVPLNHYLILSAAIFAIGVVGVVIRRNLIVVLMSIELMLNAVSLTFIAFSRFLGSMEGQVIVFFVMAVAAAEAVVGLAIIISVFRHRQSLDPQEMQLLKW